MDAQLRSTLLKLAFPLAVILLMLLASKKAGVSSKELGIVLPKPLVFFLWLAFWIAWMAVSEMAINTFGLEQAKPWKYHSFAIVSLRIAAIGILGPIAEEFMMRGFFFSILSRNRPGPAAAIVICAAGWAIAHYHYDWKTILLVFFDGLILGMARHHSRSLYPPVCMHILGNLYSIYQSLHT